MKKYLTLFLFTLSIMSSYAYDVEIDGIYYNLVPKAKQASVTNNGDETYSGDIIIPETITSGGVEYSVTGIGDGAIQYCSSLSSIQIPNSITSIGSGAFSNCISLSSVQIPNSVTSIGGNAFYGCSSLISIEIPNSVTAINDWTFCGCSSLSSIEIPNSVTSIGNYAFRSCSSLISIEIPNSVISIGKNTFESCSSLSSILIPNSVTSIGNYAFRSCSSLISIEIPNSITSIGENTFESCSSLTSIQIPNSVTSIGIRAFKSCNSLTSIQIPSLVTGIAAYTFESCSSLTSVQIPNSVKLIDSRAFNGCENLANVTLGSKLQTIYAQAFANCPNLENVYCNALDVPFIADLAFQDSYIEYANLYVPEKSLDAYKTADVWKDFGSIRTLSDVTFAEIINVSAEQNVLSVGKTETLTANVLPANTTNKSITWSSSNSDIVSVNAKTGEVTAVAYGSAVITATANDGSNVKGSITITIKAENYALTDGEEYLNDQEVLCDELTYTRNFTNTNWNALYVPMSINVEDYAGELDFAEIYAFCAMKDTNWDGVVDANDENFLYVSPMKTGCTKPNVPYMIRPKEAKTYEISSADNVLYAKAEGKVEFSTSHDNFTVTGLNETFTVTAGDNNYYVSTSGSLNYRTTGSTNVKPNRWVMHRESKEYGGGTLTESAAKGSYRIVAIGEDIDEATAIEIIKMQNAGKTANSGIYTIDGRKVNGEKSLPAGIYIKNGKKFIMK